MKYKVAFFDLDGTVLNSQGKISSKTKESITELKINGIEPIIATGRSLLDAEEIAKELNVESLITFNGNYIQYKGEEIHKHILDQIHLKNLCEEIRKDNNAFVSFGLNNAYVSNFDNPIVKEATEYLPFREAFLVNEEGEVKEVLQLNVFCNSSNDVIKYLEQHPYFKFIPWNTKPNCGDVLPLGNSKAKGIELLLKHLGISEENAIAFGDGQNDIEMLSYVGFGVAMGNAHPSLLPYADFQTKHVDEDGIYYALKKYRLI